MVSEALFRLNGGRWFNVTAEASPHGRQHLVNEGVFSARRETGVVRNRKHFGRYVFLRGSLDCPTTLPRILHEAGITIELAIKQ